MEIKDMSIDQVMWNKPRSRNSSDEEQKSGEHPHWIDNWQAAKAFMNKNKFGMLRGVSMILDPGKTPMYLMISYKGMLKVANSTPVLINQDNSAFRRQMEGTFEMYVAMARKNEEPIQGWD